jgi:pSer/pThr/pTyr-binding forkhead associated (FHA) protein
MTCPNCGAKAKAKDKFCEQCGASFAAAPSQAATAVATKFCPSGHPMDPSWTECPRCTPTAPRDLPTTRKAPSEKKSKEAKEATVPAILIGLNGSDQGKTFNLKSGENVIGAASDCDVVIANQYVSRRHASVMIEGNQFRVRDQNSRNGTHVNNTRITESDLRDNDKIRFGTEAVFQFKRLR